MTAPSGHGRRELARTVALTALGGGGIVFTAGRAWGTVVEPRTAPFAALTVRLSGRDLYPALTGLAIAALLVAVLAVVTGSWARRVLGVVLLVLGATAGWYAVRGVRQPGAGRLRELLGSRLSQQSGALRVSWQPAWAWLTLLCAVLLVLAALVLLVRAGRWQVGLSARYSAPAEAAGSADPWRRMDRGEDPTISDG